MSRVSAREFVEGRARNDIPCSCAGVAQPRARSWMHSLPDRIYKYCDTNSKLLLVESTVRGTIGVGEWLAVSIRRVSGYQWQSPPAVPVRTDWHKER